MAIQIDDTFTVKRPIEDVFAFISDFENLSRWTSSLDKVTKVTDGPIAVGTVFLEEGTFLGRTVNSEREITAYDPPTLVACEIRGTIPGRITYTFEAETDGTKVTTVSEGELGKFMTLFAPLLTPLIKKQFRKDGEKLLALLEGAEGG